MTRFLQGTTDHDSDGKMGGSLKENNMAKTPTKQPAIKADGQNQMNTAAAEQAEAVQEADAKGSKSAAQSGMEPGPSPKEERAKLNEQFAKADAKGQAAIIEETQAGIGVRGY